MSRQNRQIKKACLPPSPSLQELEARDEASFKEMLQAAKDLEKALLSSPSLEDYLAEVEGIIERMETELEAYSNG